MKKKNVFILTRPIQYANAKNIISKTFNDKNILFLYPNFKDGIKFYESILKFEGDWYKVILIKSRFQLMYEVLKLKIDKLYLSTDLGFYTIIQIFASKSFHYEEGWGTYSNGESKNLTFASRLFLYIYRVLGNGEHMGNSVKTKGVIVYNKSLHKLKFPNYKKNIYTFPLGFKQNIAANLPFFENVFKFKKSLSNYKNNTILIYATGWKIDDNILKELNSKRKNFDHILIKLHPHIRDFNQSLLGFNQLEQNVILEIYISELLAQNNNITIWHDNSSSVFYYLDEIKVRNIGRLRPQFDEIFEFFRKKINE